MDVVADGDVLQSVDCHDATAENSEGSSSVYTFTATIGIDKQVSLKPTGCDFLYSPQSQPIGLDDGACPCLF